MMSELRSATASLHAAIEHRVNLSEESFTLGQYTQILKIFYGFYKPLETRIAAYGEQPERWITGDRRKAHLLAADLQWAGLTQEQIDALPLCPLLPAVSHHAQQLGCMYVIEGATLGGQVIRHMAARHLGLNGAGTAFFSGYLEKTAVMWKAFCNLLLQSDLCESDRLAALDSARWTFLTLDRWICHMGGSQST
jgi:heme oxygenase